MNKISNYLIKKAAKNSSPKERTLDDLNPNNYDDFMMQLAAMQYFDHLAEIEDKRQQNVPLGMLGGGLVGMLGGGFLGNYLANKAGSSRDNVDFATVLGGLGGGLLAGGGVGALVDKHYDKKAQEPMEMTFTHYGV